MSYYVDNNALTDFALELDSIGETSQDLLLYSASTLFDKLANVPDGFFNIAGAGYTNRNFYGNGTAFLRLDPYVALNPTNPVIVASADNLTVPVPPIKGAYDIPTYDVVGQNLVVVNKTRPQSLSFSAKQGRFAGWWDGYRVVVSATWGFAAIPKDVQYAVIQLALHMMRVRDPAQATVDNQASLLSAPLPPIAVQIADQYGAQYDRRAAFA